MSHMTLAKACIISIHLLLLKLLILSLNFCNTLGNCMYELPNNG